MMWGAIVGVLLIVASIWLYRRGQRVYGLIGIVLGIAALLLGYWSESTIEDEDTDVPVGTTEDAATPLSDEGGV